MLGLVFTESLEMVEQRYTPPPVVDRLLTESQLLPRRRLHRRCQIPVPGKTNSGADAFAAQRATVDCMQHYLAPFAIRQWDLASESGIARSPFELSRT